MSDSAEALVEAAGVDIVDVAVPPWVQPEIVALATSAGRHILCQKPFSLEMEGARRMVEAAESSGVLLAVNQQMRWVAGMAASRDLIAKGAIGRATAAQSQVSGAGEWEQWAWLAASPRLDVMYHSIHYLDSVRSVLGCDPRARDILPAAGAPACRFAPRCTRHVSPSHSRRRLACRRKATISAYLPERRRDLSMGRAD